MTRLTIVRIAAALLLGAASLTAFAAQRTFVASYGLDTNPCTLASPCRGFAAAMAQTDSNGEVIVLDSAGYGVFTITQSVSIIAPEGVYAGISVFPGASGITTSGSFTKVVLRGLSINGQGGDDGIVLGNSGEVLIDRCLITNMGNDDLDAGIRINAANLRVTIEDTIVRTGTGNGIFVGANATVIVQRSHVDHYVPGGLVVNAPGVSLAVTDSMFSNNAVGIDVAASAPATLRIAVSRSLFANNNTGISIGRGTNGTYFATVSDNVISKNNSDGFSAFSNPNEVIHSALSGNRVTDNLQVGIRANAGSLGPATVVLERNLVMHNATGVARFGDAVVKTCANNTVSENSTADISGGPLTSIACNQ